MIANDNFFALPPVHRSPFTIRKSSDELPYHLADPGWSEIWKRSGAGEGIKVGVVDTGIDETHPEVQESLVDARDFSGSRSGPVDVDNHGTHVASTIAGKHVGVAPGAKLYIAKALGDDGRGSDRAVANAIFWLIDQGVDIINMSLGSPSPSPPIEDACRVAASKGILMFCASGNEGASASGYPAAYDAYCVSVGAVNRHLKLAQWSNRGVNVDMVHYGVDIYAAIPGGRFQAFSGTSMAAPNASGTAACRLSAELKYFGKIQTRTLDDLRPYEAFTVDLGAVGRDDKYGYGFPTPKDVVLMNLPAEPQPGPSIDPELTRVQLDLPGQLDGVAGTLTFRLTGFTPEKEFPF